MALAIEQMSENKGGRTSNRGEGGRMSRVSVCRFGVSGDSDLTGKTTTNNGQLVEKGILFRSLQSSRIVKMSRKTSGFQKNWITHSSPKCLRQFRCIHSPHLHYDRYSTPTHIRAIMILNVPRT